MARLAAAIQAGAKDFVVKPFQPARVLEAVQRVGKRSLQGSAMRAVAVAAFVALAVAEKETRDASVPMVVLSLSAPV